MLFPRFSLGLFLCFVPLFFSSAAIKTSVAVPRYLPANAVALDQILPPPPADDSQQTKEEIEQILEWQKTRTPEEVVRVQSEAHLGLEAFESVFEGQVQFQTLPQTSLMLRRVAGETSEVSEKAKRYWKRPRPPVLDSRIQPCIELPPNPAYPSGHTTLAYVWATVLAEVFPDKKEALLARAEQIGEDRIIGGVHYESDIKAGKKLGEFLAQQFLLSPSFQADLAKTKEEVRHKVLGL